MSRKPNRLKTVSLRLSTTEAIYGYLELLVSSGVYGKNPAEAAEQLIARNIVRMARIPGVVAQGAAQ